MHAPPRSSGWRSHLHCLLPPQVEPQGVISRHRGLWAYWRACCALPRPPRLHGECGAGLAGPLANQGEREHGPGLGDLSLHLSGASRAEKMHGALCMHCIFSTRSWRTPYDAKHAELGLWIALGRYDCAALRRCMCMTRAPSPTPVTPLPSCLCCRAGEQCLQGLVEAQEAKQRKSSLSPGSGAGELIRIRCRHHALLTSCPCYLLQGERRLRRAWPPAAQRGRHRHLAARHLDVWPRRHQQAGGDRHEQCLPQGVCR